MAPRHHQGDSPGGQSCPACPRQRTTLPPASCLLSCIGMPSAPPVGKPSRSVVAPVPVAPASGARSLPPATQTRNGALRCAPAPPSPPTVPARAPPTHPPQARRIPREPRSQFTRSVEPSAQWLDLRVLGIATGTVTATLHHARHHIRAALCEVNPAAFGWTVATPPLSSPPPARQAASLCPWRTGRRPGDRGSLSELPTASMPSGARRAQAPSPA